MTQDYINEILKITGSLPLEGIRMALTNRAPHSSIIIRSNFSWLADFIFPRPDRDVRDSALAQRCEDTLAADMDLALARSIVAGCS